MKKFDASWREIAAAVTKDGAVENDEILILYKWLRQQGTQGSKPLQELKILIENICADGVVTSSERQELLAFLRSISDYVSPQEKGTFFERHIISLFAKEHYQLIEWRSDKEAYGKRYPLSNQWPDLEMQDIASGKRFAIECKFRSRPSEKIKWARSSNQLENYREYQRQKGFPVYVALGLGGTADRPGTTFMVPLDHLQSHEITMTEFASYRFPDNASKLGFR